MKAQWPRQRRRKRKCKCCRELYMPDARHFNDQKYCGKAGCRRSGKQASQRRWLMSDKGVEYRDPEENRRRVREWRAVHPDYAKLMGGRHRNALQETIAESARRFVLLGQDILGNGPGNASKGDRRHADNQTNPVFGAPAPCAQSLQLGRPPSGSRSAHQPVQP